MGFFCDTVPEPRSPGPFRVLLEPWSRMPSEAWARTSAQVIQGWQTHWSCNQNECITGEIHHLGHDPLAPWA